MSTPPATTPPLLRVSWTNLLLLSWPFEPDAVQEKIPEELDIDLLHGKAWVSIIVSRMSGARPPWMFALPWFSNFLSLGVRTCVRKGSERGVYFFSIDTERAWAAWVGRNWLHLPCFRASLQMTRDRAVSRVNSERRHQGASSARLACEWQSRPAIPQTEPDYLGHFLDARHQIYTEHEGRLYTGELWHSPFCWRDVEILKLESTMLEAVELSTPEAPVVAHEAEARAIEIWPMRLVGARDSANDLLEPALVPPTAG